MSKSYLPGVRENFPDAEQIIDKFHVKKVLTDTLDKVRKQEQKETNNKKGFVLEPTFPHDAAKQNEQRTVDQVGSPLQGLSEDRTRLPDCPGFGPVLRLQGWQGGSQTIQAAVFMDETQPAYIPPA